MTMQYNAFNMNILYYHYIYFIYDTPCIRSDTAKANEDLEMHKTETNSICMRLYTEQIPWLHVEL